MQDSLLLWRAATCTFLLRCICSLFLLAALTSAACAAVPSTFSLLIGKAPHPLALDPSMNDPAWKLGFVPGGTWENVTTRRPASEATSAYILIDAKNLYVGFVAQQLEAPIVATQTTNDVGFGSDDFVAVGIDTSGSGSRA